MKFDDLSGPVARIKQNCYVDIMARYAIRIGFVALLLAGSAGPGLAGQDKPKAECAENEKVAWHDYQPALDMARTKHMPAVLVFYSLTCRKCEVLEDKGFNRPDIACYVNHKLSAARIDGHKFPELSERYEVSYFPTVWFLTPEGKKIDYFTGYVPPDKLDVILRFIGDGAYKDMSFAEFEKKLDKEKKQASKKGADP